MTITSGAAVTIIREKADDPDYVAIGCLNIMHYVGESLVRKIPLARPRDSFTLAECAGLLVALKAETRSRQFCSLAA